MEPIANLVHLADFLASVGHLTSSWCRGCGLYYINDCTGTKATNVHMGVAIDLWDVDGAWLQHNR